VTHALSAPEREYEAYIHECLEELARFVERDGTEWMQASDAKRLLHDLREQQRAYRAAFDSGQRPELPRRPRNEVQGRFRRSIEVFELLKHIDQLAGFFEEAREARSTEDEEAYTDAMRDAAERKRIIAVLMTNLTAMHKSAREGAEGRRERQHNLDSGFDLEQFIGEVQRMRAKNPKLGKRTTVDRVRKLLGITNPKATAILDRLAKIEGTGRKVW